MTLSEDMKKESSRWGWVTVPNGLLAALLITSGTQVLGGANWAETVRHDVSVMKGTLSAINGTLQNIQSSVRENRDDIERHEEKPGHDVMEERVGTLRRDLLDVKDRIEHVDKTTQEILRRVKP